MPDPTPTTPRPRLGFLDAIRGIAVLLVLAQHIGEQTWSAIPRLSSTVIDIGQLGVMVFFCCSGFIIPVSLQGNGRLGPFWISRFFRLYPLYWFSLATALVCSRLLDFPSGAVTTADWLANVTMLQRYLGRPDALGLYWSLAWEMTFYVLISALFLVRWHRQPVVLSAVANSALVAAVLLAAVLTPGRHFSIGLFSVCMMFAGNVVYHWFTDSTSTSRMAISIGYTAVTGVVVLVTSSSAGTLTDQLGLVRSPRPLLVAWLGGLLLFTGIVWAARRGLRFPALLRRWGTISYSVYLMQALVIGTLSLSSAAPWLRALAWTLGTWVVSELTYRCIERPAIAAGRTIKQRVHPDEPKPAEAPF